MQRLQNKALARAPDLFQCPAPGITPHVRDWRTIALGGRNSERSLKEYLTDNGYRLGTLASQALDSPAFAISKTRTEIDLTILSVCELGFTIHGAAFQDIKSRASLLGACLCPPEVAPELRLQYLDQPVGEYLHIAMPPVSDRFGNLIRLSVINGGAGLALIGSYAVPNRLLPGGVRLVFALYDKGTCPRGS